MPSLAITRTVARLARRVLLGAVVVLLAATAPAGADPAGPSDFRSEVTGVVPDVDGVEARIRGGDSFLELEVRPGHTVVVAGYQGEPYLRVREDGTVQRNRFSPATYANDDRTGGAPAPADVQEAIEAGAEPEWETVADSGTYAWHDHRVHWMAEASPPVDRGESVGGAYDPWVVPIDVDGEAVEIRGTLTYASTVSPVPWAAGAVVIALGLGWAGRRRAGLRAGAAVLVVVSAVAVIVGRADWAATPDGAGNPLLWVLPVVALVAAIAGTALATKGAGVVLTLASVAALSGWGLFRIEALLKPVLPTELPFALDRGTIAAALGASVAAAYLAITTGAIALPALEDDHDRG